MSKPFLLALYALGAALALMLLAGVIMLLSWRGHASAQLQAAASQALGMQVTIDGPLTLKFFPSIAVSVRDVHIRNRDSDVASAGQATLAIELVSLLRRQVRIPRVELSGVSVSLERGRDGRLNIEGSSPGATVVPAIESTDLSVRDFAFSYSNRQQGTHVQAQGCDVKASDVRVAAGGDADLMNRLSLSAHVSCRQINIHDLQVSNLRFTASCANGVLQTDDLTLRAFEGQGSVVLRADFTAPVPSYRLHAALSKFRLGEFSKNFSQKPFGEGVMDFSTGLTMAGKDADAITRSTDGNASLHGTDLTLAVGNLDAELSEYKKTQHFNLVDLGAFLLAGPIGLAVTKGYDYAKVISSSGGSSKIQTLISEWHVDHGVARATDVAMSTRSNRIALKGGFDVVNQSFQDVTVAVIDREGCAVVEQKVRGSFSHPDVGEPNIVSSLAGPAVHLLDKARHLVGGPVAVGHCQVFYAGALPPPMPSPAAAAK